MDLRKKLDEFTRMFAPKAQPAQTKTNTVKPAPATAWKGIPYAPVQNNQIKGVNVLQNSQRPAQPTFNLQQKPQAPQVQQQSWQTKQPSQNNTLTIAKPAAPQTLTIKPAQNRAPKVLNPQAQQEWTKRDNLVRNYKPSEAVVKQKAFEESADVKLDQFGGKSARNYVDDFNRMDVYKQRQLTDDLNKQYKESSRTDTLDAARKEQQAAHLLQSIESQGKKQGGNLLTMAQDFGNSMKSDFTDTADTLGRGLSNLAGTQTNTQDSMRNEADTKMATSIDLYKRGLIDDQEFSRRKSEAEGIYYLAQRMAQRMQGESDPIKMGGAAFKAGMLPVAYAAGAGAVGTGAKLGYGASFGKSGGLIAKASAAINNPVAKALGDNTFSKVMTSNLSNVGAASAAKLGLSKNMSNLAGAAFENTISGAPESIGDVAMRGGSDAKLSDYFAAQAMNAAGSTAFPVAGYALGKGLKTGIKGAKAIDRMIDEPALRQAEIQSKMTRDQFNSISDDEAYTLLDFADHTDSGYLGSKKLNSKKDFRDLNDLLSRARVSAEHAGIKLYGGGSARETADMIRDFVDRREAFKQGYNNAQPGGFVAGPLAGDFKGAQARGEVFDGFDGKPRFEIDDSGMKIKNPNGKTLGELIDHPELFKNYPQLASAKISVDTTLDHNGHFDPTTGEIVVKDPMNIPKMLEEIQHSIQKYEGFAQGTNPKAAGSYDKYFKNAGEAEGRNVGRRWDMPMSERYVKPEVDPGKAPEKWQGLIKDSREFTNPDDFVKSKQMDYHGTNQNFKRFSSSAIGSRGEQGFTGKGFYFTNRKNYAKEYGDNVIESHLNIKNPYVLDNATGGFGVPYSPDLIKERLKLPSDATPADITNKLKELGHDGVVVNVLDSSGRKKNAFEKMVIDVEDIWSPETLKALHQKTRPRSTFYDSLDVPKQDLIIRNDGGKAMSIDPKQGLDDKFKHNSWYKGEDISKKEAMTRLARSNDIVLDKRYADESKQSKNVWDKGVYDDILKDSSGRGTYKLTPEEKAIYDKAKAEYNVEAWKERVDFAVKNNQVEVLDSYRASLAEAERALLKVTPEPPKAMSADPTAALKAEALKYKSADEFIKAQGEPLYHGSPNHEVIRKDGFKTNPNGNNLLGEGVYLTRHRSKAENYSYPMDLADRTTITQEGRSAGVVDAYIPKGTKIFQPESRAELKNLTTKDLQNKGYGGVEVNGETVIFDSAKIKTKEQLTDLYNQAHTPQPKPEVAQAKVEAPKQPTPFEKSLEQAGIAPKKTEAPRLETPKRELSDFARTYAAENSSKDMLDEFVNIAYDFDKQAKGGQLIDTRDPKAPFNYEDGIKRISDHSDFYREYYKTYGYAPSKKAFREEVSKQLEYGGGSLVEKDMADAYQLAKSRESETPNYKDTTDYSLAFEKNLEKAGLAPKKELPKVTVKKETAVSREGSRAPGESKPKAVSSGSTYTQLNTNRIDLSKEAKDRIAKETSEVVKKLSNNEIKDMAKGAGIDFKSYGVEGTRKKITEQLNVRNEIFTIEKQIETARKAGNKELQVELMQKSAELGRISRSQGTDLGRQLQARRIIADSLATPQQKLYRLFDEAGVSPDVYTKRMADVDMAKPDEVVKAYRDLVPAKFSDWLDKYRYTNMLSSPLTHIVNITSNLSGLGGIAPVQKLVEGAIDATRSAVTGTPRTRFASEAGSYVSGAVKSVPEAVRKFRAIMSGKQAMDMPDADALKHGRLANKGVAGVADSVFSVIPKLLEASDQFGMTLVKGGENAGLQKRMSKGVAVAKDVTGLIEDKAKYRLFRQELNASGQGHLLEAVDFIPSMILQARNSKNKVVSTIAKFTIPFVTTPTNLFKQGIEYSPAGLLTLSGNSDKIAQLAKTTMGTSVMAVAAATLASQDAISFSEPSDAKQRDAFRAEGKQPYSIKIGDKWIQYSKLHPAIAFNLALVGGTKDALDKGAIDQPTADKVLAVGGGILGFFRDQSYMKSIGDFTSALEMKDGAQLEDSLGTVGSNWANQLVPFKSMTSWVGRMVDPTQRKVDYSEGALTQIYQSMVKDIPGLNKDVPTRNNPYYKDQDIPLENPNPILNSFSPLRVSNDLGYGNTTGLNMTQRREMYEMPDSDKEAFRKNTINQKYLDKVAKEKGGEESGSTPAKTSDKPDTGWTDEYNAAKSSYQKDSKNWSEIQRVGKEKELKTLEVKKNFSKDATRLYDMAEKDIYAYLDKSDDKKASDYLNQVVAYGDKMVEAGLWTTNKLRDKNGNVQYERGYTGSTGGSRSTSRSSSARSGSKTAKGKFDYKLNMFSDGPSGSGSASDLYALLKKATMKG